MREITEKLERNAQEVRYGSVGVELRIHDGRVVKAIYKTAKTSIERRPRKERPGTRPDRCIGREKGTEGRLIMANIIPFRLPEQAAQPKSPVDLLDDFINELYADGTVDRWKRDRACRQEALAKRKKNHPGQDRPEISRSVPC
jgi:hypothetical protein